MVEAAVAELRGIAFAVAYRMLGDPADAEDLAQETVVRWLETYRTAVERPAGFVASIAARLALNLLRDRKGRQLLLEQGLPVPIIEEQASGADWRLDLSYGVVALTRTLSPAARAVFILRNAFDLSFEEIGAHLGKSAAACRQINSRAMKTLDVAPPAGRVAASAMTGLVSAIITGDAPAVARLLADDVVLETDGGERGPDIGRPISGRERIAQLLTVSPMLLPGALDPRVLVTPSGTILAIVRDGRLVMTVVAEGDARGIGRLYVLSDAVKLGRVASGQ